MITATRTTSYDLETRRALLGQPAKTLVRAALSQQSVDLIRAESRALTPVSGAAGGFLVSQSMADAFFAALAAKSAIWNLASLDITDAAGERAYPGGDDTATVGTVMQPGDARPTTTDPTFTSAVSRPVTITSGIIRVPLELAQDSGAGGIETIVAGLLAERCRTGLDRVALVGAGGTEPVGLFSGGRVGVTAALGGSASYTYTNLVDLTASVSSKYRVAPSNAVIAKFLMRDATLTQALRLVDGSGQPIVKTDPQGRIGPTILGYQVVVDEHAPAMAASANSIAFGDFERGIVLRVVKDLKLMVMSELYAGSGQIAYLCELMADTVLVNPQPFALYQHSAS